MIKALIWAAISWPLYILLGLLLYLIGLPLIAIELWLGRWEFKESKVYPNRWGRYWTAWYMGPWQNWEDGLFPIEYRMRFPERSFFKLAYTWTALRNPVSGLRWGPLTCIPNAKLIQFVGSLGSQGKTYPQMYEAKQPVWFFCWQGLYSNFWWQFKVGSQLWRLWIGTAKLYPSDVEATNFGYRAYGAGAPFQFKRVQDGDNRN